MKNIWFLLIWLTVVAVESFLYSIFSFYLSGDMCEPEHISQAADSFIEFIDRFLNYQSWFIPLIILYWPTKARKRENRSRVRAAKHLANSSKNVKDKEVDKYGDGTSDGYTSLDGESYLDYDNRSDIDYNDVGMDPDASNAQLLTSNAAQQPLYDGDKYGYNAQNTNLFIIGQNQTRDQSNSNISLYGTNRLSPSMSSGSQNLSYQKNVRLEQSANSSNLIMATVSNRITTNESD